MSGDNPKLLWGSTVKFAYADPPYLGCCGLYDHRHEDPWGCWDELSTHQALLDYLTEFDGWAYSLTSVSLPDICGLPLRRPYRIGSWQKTFAAYKKNVRIAYAWEPVLFKPGRDSSKDGAPVGRDILRDVIAEPITMKKGLTGAKPERFCRWILDLLGYQDDDELVDIFPGTGMMDRVLAQGRLHV